MKKCYYCDKKFKPKENENFCSWKHQTFNEMGIKSKNRVQQ